MLLLKPIHKINNTLRFLTSLLARVVTSNKFARLGLFFILFTSFANKGFAQTGTGTCSDPIVIDLTGHPDTAFRRSGDIRTASQCCGASGPSTTCVSYRIYIDPSTDVLSVSLPPNGKKSNSEQYYVNCDGPYSLGTPVCITDHTIPYVISYCKPGADLSVDLVFNLTRGFAVSPGVSLRQGCTGTISVSNLIPGTIKWTSGDPTYDSYLSSTTDSIVTVNPPAVPPASGYIDYTVTGTEQSPCDHTLKSGVVRVNIYPKLNVSLSPSATTVCSGNPVTINATVSGGYPPYTYSWSYNGSTGTSITVNSAGTYTVSVSDQLSSCGPILASTTLNATSPVAPTASPVTVCTGNPATLTVTGPGGPYQWFDANHNLIVGNTSSTLTIPNPTSSTTYYVSTMYGGCQSPETAISLTVVPTPPGPTAPGVTICTGNPAVLNATAPGGPYQWYDTNHNPVGNGGSSYTTTTLTTGATNTVYYYSVMTSNGGCPSQETVVPVTVTPVPGTPSIGP